MKPYYESNGITIYNGDCRDILEQMPAVDLVATDPPYSVGRSEGEFAASGNIAVSLDLASRKAPAMWVFGTASGRGVEFTRSAIRKLPHSRILCWHRSHVNSTACGPYRWDIILIHGFGKVNFGRPEHSSLIETDGTRALALSTGHRSPVPTEVFERLYRPFAPGVLLDPFAGSGSSLLAARLWGGKAIGIEIEERYCEIAAKRLSQQVLGFDAAEAVA